MSLQYSSPLSLNAAASDRVCLGARPKYAGDLATMRGARYRTYLLRATTGLGAIVLVAAALLKVSANFTDWYDFGAATGRPDGVSLTWLTAIGVCEVTLALFLLRHNSSRSVWLVAAFAFSAFFLMSLFEALEGRKTCDCFGALIVRPYYTAALDLVLASACVGCFYLLRESTARIGYRCVLSAGVLAVVFLLSSFGAFYAREASAVSAVIGIPHIVGYLQLENATASDSHLKGELLLATRGSRPAQILSAERSCSLDFTAEFPFVVNVGEVTPVPIVLRRPQNGLVGAVPVILFVGENNILRRVTLNLRNHESVL